MEAGAREADTPKLAGINCESWHKIQVCLLTGKRVEESLRYLKGRIKNNETGKITLLTPPSPFSPFFIFFITIIIATQYFEPSTL